jgi:SAM-dependent methyltransferase
VEAPTNNAEEFWNRAAASKRFTHPLDHARFTRAITRDANILDYGCGQGRLTAELIELGYTRVVGVDSSPEMIRRAIESNPAASFIVNDGTRVPAADSSFDAVLLFAVLTCVASDDDQKNLVRELRRILRPGGLLIISDYPLQTDARNLARYEAHAAELGGHGHFRLPDGAVLRHHPRAWFDLLLADFAVVELFELEARTMNGNPARIVQLWATR